MKKVAVCAGFENWSNENTSSVQYCRKEGGTVAGFAQNDIASSGVTWTVCPATVTVWLYSVRVPFA